MKNNFMVIILTILTIAVISCSRINKEVQKPNILFIMSDDHTSQAFGIYGSRLATLNPTPNLDNIAQEGMIFDNVFCNNSICTPSRASIITGQYPQTNGVLDLEGNIPPERQYLPIKIKKAGYNTAIIGKWHLKKEPETYYRYWMHMAHKLGNPAHFGIRTNKYKLIFFYGADIEDPPREKLWGSQADIITPPGWELYDIEEDPLEMNNLYNNPEYVDIIMDLKQRLRKLREELNETDENFPHIQAIIDKHWDD